MLYNFYNMNICHVGHKLVSRLLVVREISGINLYTFNYIGWSLTFLSSAVVVALTPHVRQI